MSDSDYRFGDQTPPLQRAPNRVYESGGEWFFDTREGKPMGPFETRAEADQGLSDFIEFLQLAPLDTLATLADALSPEDADPGDDASRDRRGEPS